MPTTVAHPDGCAIMDNIYVRSRRAGERVMERVRLFLERKLKLKVNEKKSAVDRAGKRKFLGFSFLRRQGQVLIRVASTSRERCWSKLRQLTRRTQHGTLDEIIQSINAYGRGWIGYFRLADTPSVFHAVDEWLRRRMRQLLWKRWKQPKTRWRNLVALGVPPGSASEVAGSGKGCWHLAASPPVQQALNNAYWRSQGLLSITERYHQLRTT